AVDKRGRRLADTQEADAPDLGRFLRQTAEWPRRRRAAEQRDELTPFHSITSSARASSAAGISRPSVRAVFRLITSSNLVDYTTGKSAGLAPLSTRPA